MELLFHAVEQFMSVISKRWVRKYANWMEAKGLLKPQVCEDCGSSDAHKHHEDYSDPSKVAWFCNPCHWKRHFGVEHGSYPGIAGFEQITKLLAVGVSCRLISAYLQIDLKIVKRVCRGWRTRQLPAILLQRSLCQ